MNSNPSQEPPKPKRARRSKAEKREEMRGQILDAAEYLFSQRGFFGVTLKEIAQQAETHSSLVHYYFDDKKTLFDQMVLRRVPTINQSRMKAMEEYENAVGDAITVEGALHAFLDPNLDVYDVGDDWKYFGAISAMVNNTPQWGARVMDDYFDEVVYRLMELLRKALPGCPDADLFWCYHFVTGALTLTLARTGRIDRLSHGACASDDFAAVKTRMARFMAAGFREICGGKTRS